jgi:hypothetical protein
LAAVRGGGAAERKFMALPILGIRGGHVDTLKADDLQAEWLAPAVA